MKGEVDKSPLRIYASREKQTKIQEEKLRQKKDEVSSRKNIKRSIKQIQQEEDEIEK